MTEPGYYPDPSGVPGLLRFWDGQRWTERTLDVPPTGRTAAGPGAPVPGTHYGYRDGLQGQVAWAARGAMTDALVIGAILAVIAVVFVVVLVLIFVA